MSDFSYFHDWLRCRPGERLLQRCAAEVRRHSNTEVPAVVSAVIFPQRNSKGPRAGRAFGRAKGPRARESGRGGYASKLQRLRGMPIAVLTIRSYPLPPWPVTALYPFP